MDEQIGIIMRQTTYTKEESEEKMRENNNNYIVVIEKFMGIEPKKTAAITSVNQEKYKQFRMLMDESEENYRKNKTLAPK
jgi:hypothetical protein